MKETFNVFIPVVLSLTLVLSACGDSGEETDSGVATLENSSSTTSAPSTTASTSEQTRTQEEINELKLLEFSACIRGEGIDGFPDVKVDREGAIDFATLVSTGIDFQSQGFLDARVVCDPLLEGIQLGANATPDFEDINETLFEFTECLRDEGLDVGDFQLGQLIGQLQQVPPNSTREEAIAFLLGVSIDDPGVPGAIAVCEPLLATLPGQGGTG